MKLVIVESPAKAKTINKYLGSDYKVLASFGHIRDLPSKDGSVNPDEDFAMTWELSPGGKKRLNDIIAAVKDADTIVLASDPDREGEAIAWHILEELTARKRSKTKKSSASFFMKLPNPPSPKPSKIRGRLTTIWFRPTWPAALWTTLSDLLCRRFSGANFPVPNPPAAFSLSHCA